MCNRLVAPYPTGAECATMGLHTVEEVEEADMPEPLVTTREVQIAAAPAEVWDALADPDALSAWFDAEARLDLRPAGTGRFVTEDGETRLVVAGRWRGTRPRPGPQPRDDRHRADRGRQPCPGHRGGGRARDTRVHAPNA